MTACRPRRLSSCDMKGRWRCVLASWPGVRLPLLMPSCPPGKPLVWIARQDSVPADQGPALLGCLLQAARLLTRSCCARLPPHDLHRPCFALQTVGRGKHVLGYVVIGPTGLLLLAERTRVSATLPGNHQVKAVVTSKWYKIPLQVRGRQAAAVTHAWLSLRTQGWARICGSCLDISPASPQKQQGS